MNLFIFDLDNTLLINNLTSSEKHIPDEIKSILNRIKEKGHMITIASHNSDPIYFLDKFEIKHLFNSSVYGCSTYDQKGHSKVEHFNKLIKYYQGRFEPNRMIFFDDYLKYVLEARRLGIKGVQVNCVTGVTWKDVEHFM